MNEFVVGGFHTQSYLDQQSGKRKCEDYHSIQIFPEKQLYVIAAADGAGSAEYADVGARVVCEKICRIISKEFDNYFDCDPLLVKGDIMSKLKSSLRSEARQKAVKIDEFASTLMFVSVKGERVIAGHIGDGMIVYCKNGSTEVLSHPENGEFLNLTYFVTSKFYLHHLRLYKGTVENISAFYLMTDGMANIFYSRKQKNIFKKSFFDAIQKLDTTNSESLNKSIKALLESNISKRTNDDCTLVAFYLA